MTDPINFTPITGPAVLALESRKESQGQPASQNIINEERFRAVAGILQRTLEVQNYLLDRVRLTGEMPHKEHTMLYQMRQELRKASDTLQVYFLGD